MISVICKELIDIRLLLRTKCWWALSPCSCGPAWARRPRNASIRLRATVLRCPAARRWTRRSGNTKNLRHCLVEVFCGYSFLSNRTIDSQYYNWFGPHCDIRWWISIIKKTMKSGNNVRELMLKPIVFCIFVTASKMLI